MIYKDIIQPSKNVQLTFLLSLCDATKISELLMQSHAHIVQEVRYQAVRLIQANKPLKRSDLTKYVMYVS